VECAQVEGQRLDDERDEDGECGDEDRRRLFLDRPQFLPVHFAVVDERVECGSEAKDVLNVYCDTDADAGDVRVSRDVAHAGRECEGRAGRVQSAVSFWYMKNEDSEWLQRVVCRRCQRRSTPRP
jgi:hypothetical protein